MADPDRARIDGRRCVLYGTGGEQPKVVIPYDPTAPGLTVRGRGNKVLTEEANRMNKIRYPCGGADYA